MIDLSDIAPAFPFVASKGLVTIASEVEPQAFGNAYLVMEGTSFSLRFMRDRSQVFVDVGSTAAGWYRLECVLEFVDHSITPQQLGEPPDPAALAESLQLRWNDVASLFGDRQRLVQLQAFAK